MNTADVLEKVSGLPIQTRSYKTDPNHIRHGKPMVQGMYAAFHLGDSDTMISTLDSDGISLPAIQELAQKVVELHAENSEMR